ncbi:MAG: hypothetical protein EXS00_01865 [Phycisphaerales bacterium]|nr:hypothetical protein [Phycisphaerales bacterium]
MQAFTQLIVADDAQVIQLLSWYKPLLALIGIIPFAWLASTKLEKDARYFNLSVQRWSTVHLCALLAAFAAILLIPNFWIGWPVEILILAGTAFAYWKYRDARVPSGKQFKLFDGSITAYMESRRHAKAAGRALLHFTDAKGKSRHAPPAEDPLAPVHTAVEAMLVPALSQRMSRLEIAVSRASVSVTGVIDGIKTQIDAPTQEMAVQAIDYLKTIAGQDVAEKRRLQIGTCKVEAGMARHDLRVLTQGSSGTMALRIDIDSAKRLQRGWEQLGLLPKQMESLGAFMQPGQGREGVIVVAAPAGNGLTTALYALSSHHDAYTCNIKTLERAIELRLEGVDQSAFDPSNTKIDFATALQTIIRRGPDIVLACDFTEPGAARVIAAGANSNMLHYAGCTSSSATDGLGAWMRGVGDPKLAAKGLRAIVVCRLARALCSNCRQPYQAAPDLAKKLGAPADKPLIIYKAGGRVEIKNKIETCPVCQGSGFLGQLGLFEVMIISSECRQLLLATDIAGAYQLSKREGNVSALAESALYKVREGVTSLEEVTRVLGGSKPASKPASASASPSAAPRTATTAQPGSALPPREKA